MVYHAVQWRGHHLGPELDALVRRCLRRAASKRGRGHPVRGGQRLHTESVHVAVNDGTPLLSTRTAARTRVAGGGSRACAVLCCAVRTAAGGGGVTSSSATAPNLSSMPSRRPPSSITCATSADYSGVAESTAATAATVCTFECAGDGAGGGGGGGGGGGAALSCIMSAHLVATELVGLAVGRAHPQLDVRRRTGPALPARPFPPSTFLDKNRRDIGKSQSMWTDPKMETAGLPRLIRRALPAHDPEAAGVATHRSQPGCRAYLMRRPHRQQRLLRDGAHTMPVTSITSHQHPRRAIAARPAPPRPHRLRRWRTDRVRRQIRQPLRLIIGLGLLVHGHCRVAVPRLCPHVLQREVGGAPSPGQQQRAHRQQRAHELSQAY
eukprot:COSAG01_NODE_1592_length_9796_cov_5.340311_7_plen_380_part_00